MAVYSDRIKQRAGGTTAGDALKRSPNRSLADCKSPEDGGSGVGNTVVSGIVYTEKRLTYDAD